ncbi:aldehyde dehydrogenase family protein [Gordonia sp. HNM0687]|uniref:aldehyde dehydrogenase (NAD(+)) n=1 Tax=Gordonia mangrovi TaxID=2665643 RepID=A0A6L7GTQ5_9ACTN|nr:aldehyde dehydrogenase family protein [Gordonia mangrovi]MXP23404.1 aldehyde dehydrogenase family protein [Gordonia mangrovi]UVF76694.1 aldehyde dehydrogenase family protein [Gordonia mangrovi]
MNSRDTFYINGKWVDPVSDETIPVQNPTTEEQLGTVPAGSAADVDAAVAAARDAFPAWSRTSVSDRADYLRRIRDGLAKRQDEFAETIATEMGCPLRIAGRIQAALPQTVVGGVADLIESYEFDSVAGTSIVAREPVGVVGAITPWNYPLHQITNKLAPALAAGCTFVLKPSEVSPFTAYLLFDVLDEAGLPDGVVNLATGYGTSVGEAIAGHRDIDAVSFTGSLRAGQRVAEVASRNITRVTLELGGKSANVILPDADLSAAVKVGVGNAFLNGGQTCTAWTRMLVSDAQYDDVLEMVASVAKGYAPGDPLDPKTKLGPMASAAQRDRIREFIGIAQSEGARVVTGGAEPPEGFERGYFVQPTVLADVHPDSTVAQQEIFGPVLSVIRYADEDEALAIANNSDYGLSGAVWSADQDRAIAFARNVRTGSIDINGGQYNPIAPFGGYKRSGIGREMGVAGLEEFLEMKAIQL